MGEPLEDAGRELAVAGTGIVPMIDEGLGNSAYLADLGDGRALAVDVSRDMRPVRAAARRDGLRVAFAAETHLHADFLSGPASSPPAAARKSSARPPGAARSPITGWPTVMRWTWAGSPCGPGRTPGHTTEHLSFLLLDGSHVRGAFTGGSLLVGAAARTDLAGPEQTEPLARAQYASLRRLATLPDATPVYPTHGAGSFCSAPPSAERTTTIGREKAANPLLAAPDEDAFVTALLASPSTFPPYFLRLAAENRRGPAVLTSEPGLAALPADLVRALVEDGAQVIDVRPLDAYAAGHIPGSLAIALRPVFATWLGWLVPGPATALVFVRDPGQDPGEIAWQALKIGCGNLAGELAGGLPAWAAAGQPVTATTLITPGQVAPARVIDVRQASEYAGGHLPGARNIELGALAGEATGASGEQVVTMCGHGERAATAASLLERAGHTEVAILPGGPPDWSHITGLPLEAGA